MDKIKMSVIHMKNFSNEFDKLEKYCVDYPDIDHFIQIILSDDVCSKQLRGIIWQISGYDFKSILSNESYNGNWVGELNSFICDYLLNDAYFILIKPEDEYHMWEGCIGGGSTIDPVNALIRAAEENAKIFDKDLYRG